MPGFFTDGELATDPGTIFDYDVTAGEGFGSGFQRQFDTNPLALIARQARYLSEDMQALAGAGDLVDPETARAEVQSRGLDIKIPKGGMSRHELEMLQYLKQREINQNTTSARSGFGATAAGFAGGLAASLTDPINVASGFIPIVNQVRYAQWLARAGEGVFARAATRAGAGAIEGAVGAAIIEPIVYAGATSEQLDYGLMDSFLNITLGGALGGGLHVIGGAVYDRAAPPSAPLREFAAVAPDHAKRDAMQTAVEALERGDPVDVEPVFAAGFDAWHGSPHTFDRFDMSKIGTGEGTQARGLGVYLSDSKDVASPYQYPVDKAGRENRSKDGSLYKVQIKVSPSELIDLDTPLVDLPAVMQDIAREADLSGLSKGNRTRRQIEMFRDGTEQPWARATGNTLQSAIESYGQEPSQDLVNRLKKAGFKGFRYRDASDAGRATGANNYVIFDDKDIDIISRNGEPIAQRAPTDLAGLINQSRADRTQEAFNRQFVEKADEVIATEKARPKDKIESVKQDEAEFNDMVEEYRAQGRLTTETVKVDGREVLSDVDRLKQADELAAWAERRAKAFEAAAGCIEAA